MLDVLDLTIALMRHDSTSGREGEVMRYVSDLLASRDWRVEQIPVSEDRFDVLATSMAAPLVTLSTHLDTVPPYIPPRVEGDRLWGRGACDAKGIAASMIVAGERLRARDVPIALLFVVGEEVTHDGAHAANARPTSSRVLINGEPTESTLAVGTKGALRLILTARGQAAHSAYPHLGHSAIHDLLDVLADVRALRFPSDPVLGETTINVGTIAGGVADNVVAADASARVMIRLVSDADDVFAEVRKAIRERVEIREVMRVPHVRLGTLPGFATSVVAYATDVPVLTAWGTPYLFGPGSIHVAHRDDEHINIAELHVAIHAYERIASESLRATADGGTPVARVPPHVR